MPAKVKPQNAETDRKQRLAAALRVNLKRRKGKAKQPVREHEQRPDGSVKDQTETS